MADTCLKKKLPTVKRDEWFLTQNRFWPFISITIKAQKGLDIFLWSSKEKGERWGNWLIGYNNTNTGTALGGIRTPPCSSFPYIFSFNPSQWERGNEQLCIDPWKILNSKPVSVILPKQGAWGGIVYYFPVLKKFSAMTNFSPDSRLCNSAITNVEVHTGRVSGLPCAASPEN